MQQTPEHKARHIGEQPDEGGDGIGINQRHIQVVRQRFTWVAHPGGYGDGQRHSPNDQQALQQGFALVGGQPGEKSVDGHAGSECLFEE